MEKRPYVNYAATKQAAPQPKVQEEVKPIEESVAANAPEVEPTVTPDTEKTVIKEEPDVSTKKAPSVEKVNDIAETVKAVKVVNTDVLNVRSTPDYDAPNVVDQLKRGTRVNVSKEVGDFSEIGTNRYVMTKYLV
jgi:hypothetical protein